MTSETVTSETAREFYDRFDRRLLQDYARGNRRIEAAIRRAVEWIPSGARQVLDIGCGIGWSTMEIARHRPGVQVRGIDLSPRLIEVARRLARDEQVSFEVQDLRNWSEPREVYDAIVMIDVYEHIPLEARSELHRLLGRLLSARGTLILTCPSPSHQAFLRTHDPSGLQPIDEDVTGDDLSRLATDLGGSLVCCTPVTIWREDDYTHAVISRGSQSTTGEQASRFRERVELESVADRQNRLAGQLSLEVNASGQLLPIRAGPPVCIAVPSLNAYSETFIAAQIERLPTRVALLHGRPLRLDGQGANIAATGFLDRFSRRARRYLLGVGAQRLDQEILQSYLERTGARAVLAQYGPTGADLTAVCREGEIPLVVHFHGYDAYQVDTLERHRRGYAEMFEHATALVGVSRHMCRQLEVLGAPPEKIHRITYGVDVEEFAGAHPEQAPPVLLAVGRFVEKKAPHLTLLAFAQVRRRHPEARLRMIGDGPLFGACQHLARSLGLQHAVDFLGPQAHSFVAQEMQAARGFVQHSVVALDGDSEGTPVAVLEAAASGLPIVATRHAGIPDVVTDGVTGKLVEEGDIDGMAEGMIAVLGDPSLAAVWGRAGREHVRQNFSSARQIDRLWRLLQEAAA